MRRKHVIGDFYEGYDKRFCILVIASNGSYFILDKSDEYESITFEHDDEPLYIPEEWKLIV